MLAISLKLYLRFRRPSRDVFEQRPSIELDRTNEVALYF